MRKLYNKIINDLSDQGWSVQSHFIEDDFLHALIEEERELWQDGEFHKALVGSGENRKHRPEIRSDHVLWLDEDSLTKLQKIYWDEMERLRQILNSTFYIGLNDFEAHFAVYPHGSFYKKHLDQFKNFKERFISCILYLNEDWQTSDGGQLRIYMTQDEKESYIDIDPTLGTFVCFRSDLIYHEVLPAKRNRFSLTGWFKKT
ncbi:MAG TPA: 2OG-Fe(II) oxygenase [Balneolales bacterium]|nr:2OG-Fe(II) oxygenase [Balneolales bacterium]